MKTVKKSVLSKYCKYRPSVSCSEKCSTCNETRLFKLRGAVEALQELLNWSRAVLVELDTGTVENYLESTRIELTRLQKKLGIKA